MSEPGLYYATLVGMCLLCMLLGAVLYHMLRGPAIAQARRRGALMGADSVIRGGAPTRRDILYAALYSHPALGCARYRMVAPGRIVVELFDRNYDPVNAEVVAHVQRVLAGCVPAHIALEVCSGPLGHKAEHVA